MRRVTRDSISFLYGGNGRSYLTRLFPESDCIMQHLEEQTDNTALYIAMLSTLKLLYSTLLCAHSDSLPRKPLKFSARRAPLPWYLGQDGAIPFRTSSWSVVHRVHRVNNNFPASWMQQLWDLFHPQSIPEVSRGFNPITHGGNLLLKGILYWLLAFYCLTSLIYSQSFLGLPPK